MGIDTLITEELNLNDLSSQLGALFPEFSVDISSVFGQVLTGDVLGAAGNLLQALKDGILSQAGGMKNLAAVILILGILSALFGVFMHSFKNAQAADIAHYLTYLLLLSVVMYTFTQSAAAAKALLENIVLFVKLFIPTFMVALGMSSGVVAAAGYYELILLLIFGVEQILITLCLPVIHIYMMLVVMNGIWEEERLTMMIDLIRNGLTSFLKFALTGITGIGLLQSMVAPVLAQLKMSVAQKAVSSIPGLGGLAEGTAQLLVGSAVVVKNGIGVTGCLLLLLMCIVPFLKILLYALILKGSAAILGLTADKRITGCADKAGNGALLLLRTVYTACACFLIMIAVITCLVGRTA